jgi:hypothetical protein
MPILTHISQPDRLKRAWGRMKKVGSTCGASTNFVFSASYDQIVYEIRILTCHSHMLPRY